MTHLEAGKWFQVTESTAPEGIYGEGTTRTKVLPKETVGRRQRTWQRGGHEGRGAIQLAVSGTRLSLSPLMMHTGLMSPQHSHGTVTGPRFKPCLSCATLSNAFTSLRQHLSP